MNLEKAAAKVKRIRIKNKKYNDDAQHAINRKYRIKNLVFFYNLQYKNNNSIQRKLQF